jgi:hypothetical protein
MARPENRSEARALSLTLPIETFNYLVLLATLGKLGRTENEVATHILVREVYAMHAAHFHEIRIPPPADEWGGTFLHGLPGFTRQSMLTRRMKNYWVYILASRPRDTLYVGMTNDLVSAACTNIARA